MSNLRLTCLFYGIFIGFSLLSLSAQTIPLAEHPRPDFERATWQNLNGYWDFRFDAQNEGLSQNWQVNGTFDQKILVPFPWGAPLSEVADEADIAWYQREITVPETWSTKRTFLTIGASDWETTVWLDGQLVGTHQGGYTPIDLELTPYLTFGQAQKLTIRVDDLRREFTLYGKQGYGNARGIWQTVYLEARGQNYLEAVHFSPNIDEEKISVTAYLSAPAKADVDMELEIIDPDNSGIIKSLFSQGQHKITFEVPIKNQQLWSLENPHLYAVKIKLNDDEVTSYFGMRKISVVDLPGTEHPYIALNNQPIYLQLALDQSYHPEGFYTFPSDDFMREEIELSKSIGLNGIRTHVKIDIPRKLYWADKLGLLVMADVPNSWGEPDQYMQKETEYHLREMIKRDFNHPSIFSWIVFNETWGLITEIKDGENSSKVYLPETQQWVASMYHLTKSLDATRLVEDNSICCGRGHVETDINSWHAYLPGWAWEDHLENLTENTFEGSSFDYEPGFAQGRQPNINSECGNVWGYEGSTGDVDWSYDYHRMMNAFRKYPKVAGWLYTEHHDVINEWNGYWRFDRSEKELGLGEIHPGMRLNDFHSAIYLSTGNDICLDAIGGSTIDVPLFLSVMTDQEYGPELQINYELFLTDRAGETELISNDQQKINYQPWMQKQLSPLSLKMPDRAGLALLRLKVIEVNGNILHHNFMHFVIKSEEPVPNKEIISINPGAFSEAQWSKKQWNVLEGKKINGAGQGSFTYAFVIPEDLDISRLKKSSFKIEVSAKELFVKDEEENFNQDQDYMKGSRVAPSSNPNAYPMTDETTFPSEISIVINGKKSMTTRLEDDPADHRGVLSWHNQPKDRTLHEAGSYGYLISVPIAKKVLRAAQKMGSLQIEIKAEGEGGIAIYGKDFGRYPIDPSLVFSH